MKVSISIGAYNRVDVLGLVDYIQQAEKAQNTTCQKYHNL